MKISFLLNGLSCANCAAQIENEAAALSGVVSAHCSIATSTLTLYLKDNVVKFDYKALITEIAHRHEQDITVTERNERPSEIAVQKIRIARFVMGLCLLAVAVLTHERGFSVYIFLLSYITVGYSVVLKAIGNLLRGKLFDENCLMSIATIGAFAIGEYTEASAVMLFYLVGESFQQLAVSRSRRSIAELMDIRQDYANLVKDNIDEPQRVRPEEVSIGDLIVVKPGERIPLDGIVTEGVSALDTKALTGEPAPRSVRKGDVILSGCINLNGVLIVTVTARYAESTVEKILELVENAAEKKAITENFITKFARYYTPAVVAAAFMLVAFPVLLFNGEFSEWLHRALVFLVVSCPCALVVSIPLGFFAGIGCASRNGILVKGGNYLEALANLDIVVFDKTGTLTKGVFNVTGIYPAGGYSKEELLAYAALAECRSNHPIAVSILRTYGKTVSVTPEEYIETAGCGISVLADGVSVLAGNAKFLRKEGIVFDENPSDGTKVYISVKGCYAGCIIISDEIKEDAAQAVAGLKKIGLRKTIMLTGDDEKAAKFVAEAVGVDMYIANLLPAEKVMHLEKIAKEKRNKGTLAFAGDGINDAPVLARADIGVAMGGLGSDAAIEAADVILMTDEPSGLIKAVLISKSTRRVVMQNIVFALCVKGLFLVFGAFGASGMWEAVFADVGVALIAVLNASRVLKMHH